ncbi:MAG: hypothetical protein AABM32_00955 [Chloroflexota bacterium]
MALDDGREMRVAPRELSDAISERLWRELNGHVSQTRGPTFL